MADFSSWTGHSGLSEASASQIPYNEELVSPLRRQLAAPQGSIAAMAPPRTLATVDADNASVLSTNTARADDAAVAPALTPRQWVEFACDPCIDRPSRIVRMILHGNKGSSFWQQVSEAIRQVASNLRVTLEFELYESYDPVQMAADIRQTTQQALQYHNVGSSSSSAPQHHPSRPDVLVVTLPTAEVEEAVREAVQAGLPVFGMNSGYHRASDLGLLAFCGMDEYQAGVLAGQELVRAALPAAPADDNEVSPLLSTTTTTTTTTTTSFHVLFVNHEKGNFALEQRREGLAEGVRKALEDQARAVEAADDQAVRPEGTAEAGALFGDVSSTKTTTTVSSVVSAPGSALSLDNNDNNINRGGADIFTPNHTSNNRSSPLPSFDIQVTEVILQGTDDPNALALIEAALQDCPFDGMMVGPPILDATLQALQTRPCRPPVSSSSSSAGTSTTVPAGLTLNNSTATTRHARRMALGSFDTNTRLYREIAVGRLDFSISQQQWLQAAMTTLMASVYASTGMRLQYSHEAEFGTYLSGPHSVTLQNLPSDTLQDCETQGFPLCRQLLLSSSSSSSLSDAAAANVEETNLEEIVEDTGDCLCFARPTVRLAVVAHGTNTDSFWWLVRSASQQAAEDMQVQLEWELNSPEDSSDILHTKMASQMISYCQQGTIDGLIVTIPSDLVTLALEQCQAVNIPVISINAGADISQQLGLMHHVAQDEFTAGYLGGKELINAGATRGLCMNHVPDLEFVVDRCRGMEKAFVEQFPDDPFAYVGMAGVLADNADVSVARTSQLVNDVVGGDWNEVGMLTMGNVLLEPLLTLLEEHPESLGATFDGGPEVSIALEQGSLVFGIDQQAYLQGYMPVVLLSWFAQAKQRLTNQYISSGPSLILQAPSAPERQCEEEFFAVCPPPVYRDFNYLGRLRHLGDAMAGIILVTTVVFGIWIVRYRRKPVVRRSQPFFLVMVCVGTAVMGSTIFALAVDDEHASSKGVDVACMTAPWLFTVGFTVVFAALYSKLMRLNKLIATAEQFRRITVTVPDVMMPFAMLLSLNLVLLTTWTILDPMYWKRSNIDEEDFNKESYGLCRLGDTAVSISMAVGIFCVNISALVLALLEAYKSRKVSYEFSDSGSIALVVVSMFQVAIVGVPILPLVRDDPSASFLLKSGLVFVISMSTLLFTFLPKLRSSRSNMPPSSLAQSIRPGSLSARGSYRFALSNNSSEGSFRSVDSFTTRGASSDPTNYLRKSGRRSTATNCHHLEGIAEEGQVENQSNIISESSHDASDSYHGSALVHEVTHRDQELTIRQSDGNDSLPEEKHSTERSDLEATITFSTNRSLSVLAELTKLLRTGDILQSQVYEILAQDQKEVEEQEGITDIAEDHWRDDGKLYTEEDSDLEELGQKLQQRLGLSPLTASSPETAASTMTASEPSQSGSSAGSEIELQKEDAADRNTASSVSQNDPLPTDTPSSQGFI